MNVEADTTKNIPIELRINDRMINRTVLIFDIPMSPIPNSSGSGEAIISAPNTGRCSEML